MSKARLEVIQLNPDGPAKYLVSVADKIGVNPITLCSAIYAGMVRGAVKKGGRWYIEPGAVWHRRPNGTNQKNPREGARP
jgi:hypothetical protein